MKKKKLIYPFFVILITWIVIIFLPFYDSYNQFYFPVSPEWKSNFASSENAVTFFLIKKCLKNTPLYFEKNETITAEHLPVEKLPDLIEINETFRPIFPTYVVKGYCQILKLFHPKSEGETFFYIILLNFLLLSLVEICFFWALTKIGISYPRASIFTVLFTLSTGFLIYVRHIFLLTWVFSSFIIFSFPFLFFEEKWWKRLIGIGFLFLGSILSTPHLANWFALPFIAILTIVLTEKRKLHPLGVFLIIVAIVLFGYIYLSFNEKRIVPYLNRTYTPVDLKNFGLFNDTNDRITPNVYPTVPYYFPHYPRNAIYLPGIYAFFYHLFSERGIVFNSPYLIFSVFGFILLYKKKKRQALLFGYFSILYLLLFSFYPEWFGGGSPRYDRYMLPLCFILALFSFYYLDHVLKKKHFSLSIFLLLLVLSILNVTSISIRRDWVYTSDYNLFSYDIVIWPWFPLQNQKGIVLSLTSSSELDRWYVSGSPGCHPYKESGRGLITDPCWCVGESEAMRLIEIPAFFKEGKFLITVRGCADKAGNDGTLAVISVGKTTTKTVIPPNECQNIDIVVNVSKTFPYLPISLSAIPYKRCFDEWVVWKEITITPI